MLRTIATLIGAGPLLLSCAGSVPEPRQALADAESASRSAREVGADAEPQAKLHVRLASEQLDVARSAIANGENERATYVIERARADAELFELGVAAPEGVFVAYSFADVDERRGHDQAFARLNGAKTNLDRELGPVFAQTVEVAPHSHRARSGLTEEMLDVGWMLLAKALRNQHLDGLSE